MQRSWVPVPLARVCATMREGREILKKLEGGKWKWAATSGDCISTSIFQCNGHVECGRLLKVQKVDDSFYIMGSGEHAAVPKEKKRKNSTLTWEEDEKLRFAVDLGGRPAAVQVAMTKKKIEELRKEGKNPEDHKRAEGGLQGEQKPPNEPGYVYPLPYPYHILTISSQYPVTLPRTIS